MCECAAGYEGVVSYDTGFLSGCNKCSTGFWAPNGNGQTCSPSQW
jgi:hypothetical protein